MAYNKFTVDNVTCSRRFHLAYDDESKVTVPKTEVRCPYCEVVIYSAENHQPVELLRQENLIKTQELSDTVVEECNFRDALSEKTVPQYKGQSKYLYKD